MKLFPGKYGGDLSCKASSGKATFGYVSQHPKFSLGYNGYTSTCCRGHTMAFQPDGFRYDWGTLSDLSISFYKGTIGTISLFVRGRKRLTEGTP